MVFVSTLWRLIVYSRLTTSLMADLGFLSRAILFFMIRFQSENYKKWNFKNFDLKMLFSHRKPIFSLSQIKFQLYSENAY